MPQRAGRSNSRLAQNMKQKNTANTDVQMGLTAAEARDRLASEGPNELPRTASRTVFKIVGEVLREPMLALLVGGGILYLVLGDLSEALILLAFAIFSVVLTVVQETRTEHVLEALRDLSAPRAMVIRGGSGFALPDATWFA